MGLPVTAAGTELCSRADRHSSDQCASDGVHLMTLEKMAMSDVVLLMIAIAFVVVALLAAMEAEIMALAARTGSGSSTAEKRHRVAGKKKGTSP